MEKTIINWDISREDADKIESITLRYWEMRGAVDGWDLVDIEMSLTACHLNGCPLDLDKLLLADNAVLAHDVAGICNKIDRETGRLIDFFLPRCAR